jgi:dimethylaniline monooxygenase (N-oxide forming)
MNAIKKTVGIIGAGPSGLIALKELLGNGVDAFCFEQSSKIGGVYAYSYSNLKLTGIFDSTSRNSYFIIYLYVFIF